MQQEACFPVWHGPVEEQGRLGTKRISAAASEGAAFLCVRKDEKKMYGGKARNCTKRGEGGEKVRQESSLTGIAAAGFLNTGFFGHKIVTVVLGTGDDARKTRFFENVGKFGQGFLIFFAVLCQPVDDFVKRLT